MKKNYIIITNNPLVPQKIADDEHEVQFMEITYEEVLKVVRDRIHAGHLLLSHPLSGSVKPNETPYKSVMISRSVGKMDAESLTIIENAIMTCGKFQVRWDKYAPHVYADFQEIDLTLLESAIASADVW